MANRTSDPGGEQAAEAEPDLREKIALRGQGNGLGAEGPGTPRSAVSCQHQAAHEKCSDPGRCSYRAGEQSSAVAAQTSGPGDHSGADRRLVSDAEKDRHEEEERNEPDRG